MCGGCMGGETPPKKPPVVPKTPVVVPKTPVVVVKTPVVVPKTPVVVTETPVVVKTPVVVTETPVAVTEPPAGGASASKEATVVLPAPVAIAIRAKTKARKPVTKRAKKPHRKASLARPVLPGKRAAFTG